MTLLISGVEHHVPGVPVIQGEPLPSTPRSAAAVDAIVLHESVTTTTRRTVRVLRAQGYGCHLIIGPDAEVTQHGDLGSRRMIHAGGWNGPSVGIEVVNPYRPQHAPRRGPWRRVIRGAWVWEGEYTVPTICQLEACAQLVEWLTSDACPLAIPRTIVGYDWQLDRVRMRTYPERSWGRRPGVVAHGIVSAHADGAFPALYCVLRIKRGLSPARAYTAACELADGASYWADLPPEAPS